MSHHPSRPNLNVFSSTKFFLIFLKVPTSHRPTSMPFIVYSLCHRWSVLVFPHFPNHKLFEVGGLCHIQLFKAPFINPAQLTNLCWVHKNQIGTEQYGNLNAPLRKQRGKKEQKSLLKFRSKSPSSENPSSFSHVSWAQQDGIIWKHWPWLNDILKISFILAA